MMSQSVVRSSQSAELIAAAARGVRLHPRQRLSLFLNEPGSSIEAVWFGRLMWTMLFLYAFSSITQSIVVVTVITGGGMWLTLKWLFNVFFTFEALARFIAYYPLRECTRDVFFFIDLLTNLPFWLRLLVHPKTLMDPDSYLATIERNQAVRVCEALASLRLLKLSRYYDGAALLARAITDALQQLFVPLFMLVIMMFSFACIMFEIEWDDQVGTCLQLWMEMGIERSFLTERPHGVDWTCDVCNSTLMVDSNTRACVEGIPTDVCNEQIYLCMTCLGYPVGHAECAGKRFDQRFPDVPRSMWFMMVTVTTVGYGDLTPQTWRGQAFACIIIICGVVFLAMPLAIVGNTLCVPRT
jgi:hypothetical protein